METANQHGAKVHVFLDVFSGRPNPVWALSGTQVKELREMVGDPSRELPRVGLRPTPNVGYRGFLVLNRDRVEGLPFALRLCRGVITVRDDPEHDGEEAAYEDLRGIERWLLAQAAGHGYGEIVQHFEGAVSVE